MLDENQQLFIDMNEFANKVFNAPSPVSYLQKLKNETEEAIKDPEDLYEYADCLLCLYAAAAKAGFSYDDLINTSIEKLEAVKTRKWELMDDGTYQHIKE